MNIKLDCPGSRSSNDFSLFKGVSSEAQAKAKAGGSHPA